MHVRDNRVYQLCRDIYPMILQSDRYVGEMDLLPGELTSLTVPYELRNHFNLNDYFKIRKQVLTSFRLDIEKYVHLHPLILLSAISQSILEADHVVSLDEHLWNYARDNQVPQLGLESVNEQMEILHSIDPVPMYKQLKDIASKPWTIRKSTNKALELYLKGEIHLLYRLTKSSMHRLRKKIIYERNTRMANRMTQFDHSLGYFYTVGAGHLSGRSGLISLLRKQGFKVKPVKGFLLTLE